MNRVRPTSLLLIAVVLAVLALSGCAQGSSDSSSASDPSHSQAEESVSTLQGTLYSLDPTLEFLVILTDDGYFRIGFSGQETDLSDLEPGDSVTATYTGTLDQSSEDITAQLVSIVKDS